ncbi:MAG TPA: arylesterase [Leucothrix mucor]|nr:arylesterase [Leucothrix mucor]
MKQGLLTVQWGRSTLKNILLIMVLLFSVSSFAKEKPTRLLVWGDSLSAAYGIPIEKGWVSLLQNEYKNITVINGSISGETTQGGLTRLPDVLKKYRPNIVLIELGANDGLRGLAIKRMRENLQSMIEAAQKAGAKVILAGMKIPPNYGFKYTQLFEKTYVELATKYKISLIPFLLADIADKFELVQADGLHPTAEAQVIILQNVREFVDGVLVD